MPPKAALPSGLLASPAFVMVDAARIRKARIVRVPARAAQPRCSIAADDGACYKSLLVLCWRALGVKPKCHNKI